MTVKVLVIDDKVERLQRLTDLFSTETFEIGEQEERFVIETAKDGLEGMQKINEFQPEIILLDVVMPESPFDGFEVCRKIRRSAGYNYGERGIILFSEHRTDLWDIQTGDYIGADRYVVTPVDEKQLIIDVKQVLRLLRYHRGELKVGINIEDELNDGLEIIDEHLSINWDRYSVIVDGTETRLARLEYRLLEYLRSHLGKICQHNDIMDYVWIDMENDNYTVANNTLQKLIATLRAKIGDQATHPRQWRYIHTIQGIGYMMEKPNHV